MYSLPSVADIHARHGYRPGATVIIGTHDPDPGITLREWVAEIWADTKSALVLLAVGVSVGTGLGMIVGWLVWGPS